MQEDGLRNVQKQAYEEDCNHCAEGETHKRSALKKAGSHAAMDGHVNQVTFEQPVKELVASSTASTHIDMDSSMHSVHSMQSSDSHGGHGHDHMRSVARKKLKRRDVLTGIFILACGLFSIFLFIGYKPHERRADVHTTQMRAFALPITSPLYAVSKEYPLVFGGHEHGALAPGNARSCIDIRMIDSCLGTDQQCMAYGGGHRRLHAVSGENGLPVFGHNRRLAEDGASASLVWEFWAGGTGPDTPGARLFLNDTIRLREQTETEYLQTCIDPASHDVGSDEPLFFRMTTDRKAPVGMMLQLIEMGPIGHARVILAGVLFLLTFGLILSEVINRVYAALCGVCLGLGLHMLVHEKPELQEIMHHVDWGTLVLLFAMMINVHVSQPSPAQRDTHGTVAPEPAQPSPAHSTAPRHAAQPQHARAALSQVLSLTGFFQWVAVRVAAVARGNAIAIFCVLAALSGLLSAFLDNVTCVMLMGPVTISLCRQMKVPPVPFYLTQTLTATIGGTATMVGDPPNVVIGNKLGLPFNAFMIYNGPLVVLFLMPVAIAMQYWRFHHVIPRHVRLDILRLKAEHRIVDQKALLYTGIVLCCLFIAFFTHPVHHNEPAVYCLLGMMAICLAVSRHHIRHLLEAVEWDTLIFFGALFIFVELLAELGLIRWIGSLLTKVILSVPDQEQRVSVACLVFLWVSALGSAFLESLPYTTTIVAILATLRSSGELGIPTEPLAWALSVGACVGGIGSIMGSSANLVSVAVSHRHSPGDEIHGYHFLKYGFPLLIVLTLISSLYQYVVFSVIQPYPFEAVRPT